MTKRLQFKNSGGLSAKSCVPHVVTARVVRVVTYGIKMESSEEKIDSDYLPDQVHIGFNFEVEGRRCYAETLFHSGNVIPALGDYVRAVVVPNQWGSWQLSMSHIYKPGDDDEG